MCGIGGFLSRSMEAQRAEAVLRTMTGSLRHRGPDGEGVFHHAAAGVGLAHTRLAILDLTDAAAQPMRSACGRFALIFNGEIYNHRELREPLLQAGVEFRSDGDTETLLQLLRAEGEACLPRLNGMFAFAFADFEARTLLLARDAFGQKPLYWASVAEGLVFSSETRALRQAGLVQQRTDPVGLASLARKGSVATPRTHLEGVSLLPPGSWMRVQANGCVEGPVGWWRTPWIEAAERPEVESFEEAVELLAPVLLAAASRALLSDVPVGAFLSGGIDSAAACALLAAAGARDLRTFTVTLPGHALDEAEFARATAELLGTRHTEIPMDAVRGRTLVQEARRRADVPGTDGPNTFVVASAVREAGCRVAVSGIGGDELFGGYPSFRDAIKLSRWLPRRGAGRRTARALGRLLPGADRGKGKVARLRRALLDGMDGAALYAARRSLSEASRAAMGVEELLRGIDPALYDYAADVRARTTHAKVDAGNYALDCEQCVYLPDQLLRDTDQFSMAVSLEVRAPFLDTELARAAARIPGALKAERGVKALLVAAAERAAGVRLPRAVVQRCKQGFALPIGQWLRGEKASPSG